MTSEEAENRSKENFKNYYKTMIFNAILGIISILYFTKEKNIIAFPVNVYKNGKYVSEAQIYKIDLEKGFTLQGEIKNENISSKNYSYSNIIERIIYSNNVYYTLSKKLIKAVDMKTLKEITKLEIE